MPTPATPRQATTVGPDSISGAEHPLTVRWVHSAAVPLSAASILDPRERARLDAFRHLAAARDYLAAHVAARCAIGELLSVRPSEVVFARTPDHPKRFVPDTEIHFSLSHSHGLGLVALGEGGPVGVDSEHRERQYNEQLFRRILADREADDQFITSKGAPERFLSAWTRKEAVLKALGMGLAIDPREVVVGPQSATLFPGSVNEVRLPMWTRSFRVGSDHICAVASTASFSSLDLDSLPPALLAAKLPHPSVTCRAHVEGQA